VQVGSSSPCTQDNLHGSFLRVRSIHSPTPTDFLNINFHIFPSASRFFQVASFLQVSPLNPVSPPHTCHTTRPAHSLICITFFLWRCDPTRVMASSFLMFLDHTQRRTSVGMTPLDGWSARRRDLYLTTHNNHIRQISMPPVGFEPTISAGERPQTYVLDRAATGTGIYIVLLIKNIWSADC